MYVDRGLNRVCFRYMCPEAGHYAHVLLSLCAGLFDHAMRMMWSAVYGLVVK